MNPLFIATDPTLCLNGHPKAEFMNNRGVCSRCKDEYFVKIRTHGPSNRPKTLQGSNHHEPNTR
jgi:hypothetical protein